VGPLLLALAVILVWSACFVAIKASLWAAPPWAFAGLRALLAGMTLLSLAGAAGRLRPPPRAWGWIAALGLANTTVGLSAMFLSVGLAGAALPAVLANSQALLVAPLAALLFREPLSLLRFAALLAGVAGVGVVLAATAGGGGTGAGAALGLAAAAGLAVANLIIKHVGARIDALTATAWQYVLGAVPLVVWSWMAEDWGAISWNAEFIAALLFLGVVGSAGASYAWYRLVQHSELIRLNALTLLTPFFSVVLALILYGEPFSGRAALGAVLILAGITGVAWPGGASPRTGR
jgi:drug/metabolite transporter (DMT)-like permease